MKTFVYLLPLLFFACNSGLKKSQIPAPGATVEFVSWDTQMHELGKVKKGDTRSMEYNFTNTSGEVIKIDIVDACECTTVEFPRGELKPGEKGTIEAVFDSTEKDESETITIRVIFTNTTPEGYPRIEKLKYSYELVGK